MNIFIIVAVIYFLIGAFSYHFMMPKEDKEKMSKNKLILTLFLLFAPIAVGIALWESQQNKS